MSDFLFVFGNFVEFLTIDLRRRVMADQIMHISLCFGNKMLECLMIFLLQLCNYVCATYLSLASIPIKNWSLLRILSPSLGPPWTGNTYCNSSLDHFD